MDIQRLLRQVKMDNLSVKKVVFEMEDGSELVFEYPEVIETNFMGEKVYQVKGEPKKLESNKEEDVRIIMEQLGISKEEAFKLLEDANWDLAEALTKGEEIIKK